MLLTSFLSAIVEFITFLEGTYFLREPGKGRLQSIVAAAAASARENSDDKGPASIIKRMVPSHRLSILKHSDTRRLFEPTGPVVNNEYLNQYSDSDEEEEKRQAEEEDLAASGNDKDAHDKMKKVPKTDNEKAQKKMIEQLQQRVGELEKDIRALKKMKNQLDENEKEVAPQVEQLTKERESYSQVLFANYSFLLWAL